MPPVLTLKAARALGAGSTLTVRAVVLNGPEMGNIRYVQDGEADLALYSTASRPSCRATASSKAATASR